MSENDTLTGDIKRERIVEMLKRDNGVKVPEIAQNMNKPREEIREVLRELNQKYEFGTSSDFRYKIVGEGNSATSNTDTDQ